MNKYASGPENNDKCDKCNMMLPYVEYKGKKYCNWYCAKKG